MLESEYGRGYDGGQGLGTAGGAFVDQLLVVPALRKDVWGRIGGTAAVFVHFWSTNR